MSGLQRNKINISDMLVILSEFSNQSSMNSTTINTNPVNTNGNTVSNPVVQELKGMIDSSYEKLKTDMKAIVLTEIYSSLDKLTEIKNKCINEVTNKFEEENEIMKQKIYEQQKCVENLWRENNSRNVFISGIPRSMESDDGVLESVDDKCLQILRTISINMTADKYEKITVFPFKENRDSVETQSIKI